MSGVAREPSFTVLLAGIEKEADLMVTFMELSALMPEKTITIVMVGPLISPQLPVTTFHHCKLSITRCSGTLQDYLRSRDEQVDLTICLNAGLSAYSSWRDAIIELLRRKLKCYVTDYCLLSLDMSQQALLSLEPQIHTQLKEMTIQDGARETIAVVTDSNESEKQATPVRSDFSVRLGDPLINPFRDPKRKYCESARFPWFSNALICELVYGY